MPINRYLNETSFGPDEIKIIVAAFEGAYNALGLADRNNSFVKIVAKAVIRAARHGMGSLAQIRRRALLILPLS